MIQLFRVELLPKHKTEENLNLGSSPVMRIVLSLKNPLVQTKNIKRDINATVYLFVLLRGEEFEDV